MTENTKRQLQKITDDLDERMKGYHSSLEPTNDEITIAWLLMTIIELQTAIDFPFMTKEGV